VFQSFPWHDAIAALITLILALLWLRMMDAIAHQGWLEPKLSRKIIHIGTGPLFVLCWPLFSDNLSARYFAALVPLSITVQFIAIGLGLVFVVCTIFFWRNSPVGIMALMMMCGGDGLADIVGRRWGIYKLPFSFDKSWAGSAAMFGGSVTFALAMLAWFEHLGLLVFSHSPTVGIVAAIALIVTLVEALPFRDIDNLTIAGTAITLGLWWLSP
jgi:phytol kinase